MLIAWTLPARSYPGGESASSSKAWLAWRTSPEAADRPLSPPDVVVEVKSLACSLPAELGIPQSRLSIRDLRDEVERRGIVARIGASTIWRWLSEDAIRPWRQRSWIFPRDPEFRDKASRVLDLYAGKWKGRKLGPRDYVLSADEKPNIQILERRHPTVGAAPGRPALVEHEYVRHGVLAYLAAWDVRRARLFGHCAPATTIVAFDQLVERVMTRQPYRSARRVFWIMDNGTAHRGERCVQRLRARWPRIVPVHLPIHASWLNQVEIYLSVVQRKVLTPLDCASREDLTDRLLCFQGQYEQMARPFEWRFTRRDLDALLERLEHLPTAA